MIESRKYLRNRCQVCKHVVEADTFACFVSMLWKQTPSHVVEACCGSRHLRMFCKHVVKADTFACFVSMLWKQTPSNVL